MPFSGYIYSNVFKFQTTYVLPIIASLLTYVVVGRLYTTSLSENDLISSRGHVSVIKQDIFLDNNGRDATKRVSVKLSNSNNNFFLFDNSGDIYELIKQNLKVGDEVSILHRTLLQSIVGFGNEFQIFKFEKGGEVLYSFDEAKQTFGAINIFVILVMVGLWFLYFYFRHILKLHKKQQPTQGLPKAYVVLAAPLNKKEFVVRRGRLPAARQGKVFKLDGRQQALRRCAQFYSTVSFVYEN